MFSFISVRIRNSIFLVDTILTESNHRTVEDAQAASELKRAILSARGSVAKLEQERFANRRSSLGAKEKVKVASPNLSLFHLSMYKIPSSIIDGNAVDDLYRVLLMHVPVGSKFLHVSIYLFLNCYAAYF